MALLAGLLAPSAARAACGDYVVVGGAMQHAPDMQHPGNPPTALPEDAKPASPKDHPRPCSGPHCSERRAPLAPAPAPVPPRTSTPEGCLTARPVFARESFLDSFCPSASGSPVRRPSAVYHPPRPSLSV